MVAGLTFVLLLAGATALWLTANGAPPAWLAGITGRDATWARMVDDATFRVGMDPSFPPFEQLNEAGAPAGYDVDLAHALANRWSMRAVIVPIGFDSLLDAVKTAQVDAVISAMPFDERQTRDVAYSQPYFEAGTRLAVRAGSPITDTSELNGQRVAIEWGSAGDMIARRLQRDEGVALEPVLYDTPEAALAAVTSGETDALLVDQVSLRMAQGAGAPLIAVGPVLESNPYVIVTPRKAPQLTAAVNEALSALRTDGTLATLSDRWFGVAASLPATGQETP
jgi:polar amino acid transport system substrate-binding protein